MDILLDNEIHQEIFPLDHYKLVNTIQNSNYLLIPIKQNRFLLLLKFKYLLEQELVTLFVSHTIQYHPN